MVFWCWLYHILGIVCPQMALGLSPAPLHYHSYQMPLLTYVFFMLMLIDSDHDHNPALGLVFNSDLTAGSAESLYTIQLWVLFSIIVSQQDRERFCLQSQNPRVVPGTSSPRMIGMPRTTIMCPFYPTPLYTFTPVDYIHIYR